MKQFDKTLHWKYPWIEYQFVRIISYLQIILSQKICTTIIPITNVFGYIETSTNCLIERHQIIYDFVTALDINICHTHRFGEWLLLINAAAAFLYTLVVLYYLFVMRMNMSLSKHSLTTLVLQKEHNIAFIKHVLIKKL